MVDINKVAKSTTFDDDDVDDDCRVIESPDEGECSNDSAPTTSQDDVNLENPKQSDRHEIEDFGCFVIDRNEMDDITEEPIITEPDRKRARTGFSDLVTAENLKAHEEAKAKKQKEQQSAASKKPKMQCFNCDGDHNLNKCPEPKNLKKIREGMNAMREARQQRETARYHDPADSSSQKFKPGRISQSLRGALGIGPDDIPEWIYRMRKMGFIEGYPPGYLKQAIKAAEKACLDFHMADDGEMGYVGEGKKEEKEEEDEDPPKIIESKMIYYCGFNQTYRHLRDRENFRVPPFQEFVEFHQEELNRRHEEGAGERKRIRERKKLEAKRKAKKFAKEAGEIEDDDVVCLTAPPPPRNLDDDVQVIENPNGDAAGPSCSSSSSMVTPAGKSTTDRNGSTSSETPAIPTTPIGHSERILMVTPMIEAQPDRSGISKTPDLANFSKGIIPFEAKEEATENKGFLKKIFAKIKSFGNPGSSKDGKK